MKLCIDEIKKAKHEIIVDYNDKLAKHKEYITIIPPKFYSAAVVSYQRSFAAEVEPLERKEKFIVKEQKKSDRLELWKLRKIYKRERKQSKLIFLQKFRRTRTRSHRKKEKAGVSPAAK